MPSWRKFSYRTKLFIMFIALSSIPAFLIGITAYQKSSAMYLQQSEQDLGVILAQLTESFERQISDFDRFSMLPYYMPDIFEFLNKPAVSADQWGREELEAQRTMARLMSAYPSINSSIQGLMICGMNGSVNGYRTFGQMAINPQAEPRSEDWYAEALEREGGFVTTGVRQIGQFRDEPFRAIVGARLLYDDYRRPLAVIAMFISTDFIPKIVRSLALPNVHVTVLDKDRELVYTSDEALADRLANSGDSRRQGTWEIGLPGGDNVVYRGVFEQSSFLGWHIYMGVDKRELLKGSHAIRDLALWTVALLIVIAGAASWFLARGLAKPIYRLIRSMREVEKGKFSVPSADDREDEIGRLESSYRRMVLKLDELVQSIEEQERHKRHAELYALRARIQPHFLFNTLNSIRMLAILQQSPHIAKLIQALSRLLRANMRLDQDMVPLREEIHILQEYATLMDLRYTNVFAIHWEIDERLLSAAVPPMIVQPLLENAIFHGAKGLKRTLAITVAARFEADGRSFLVEVADDGVGFAADPSPDAAAAADPASHIGLKNVRDRIRLRFGEEYGLTLERAGALTRATLRMPYQPAQNEVNDDVEHAGRR
ncbi:cache domain-containing sensor histidine kinase [Paenibacillus ginsengihumi]|uniref:cache domain-containing sensor histidine kinase n=1 Tax=Paenibacillus ginsengihumi TaxID=431596 RepID=UPI000361871D|nr:sensor histidine kinase [Paenibacillus ginsengihumi]